MTVRPLLVLILMILCAAPVSAAVVSRVVAVVNGEIVTSLQLEAAVRERQLAEGVVALAPTARREVLDILVEERLIAQRAAELGIKVDDEDVEAAFGDVMRQNRLTRDQLEEALRQQGVDPADYKQSLRRQILRFKVIGREVQSRIDVSTRELREYYEQHADRFREPSTVHLKHLGFSFAKGDDDAKNAARRRAEDARRRLNDGSPLDEILAWAAANGGEGKDIGTFRPDELSPAFARAIVGVKDGDCGEIVESGDAHHILCVVRTTPGRRDEFDAVKERIRGQLVEDKKSGAFRAWMDELKKKARIDIRS